MKTFIYYIAVSCLAVVCIGADNRLACPAGHSLYVGCEKLSPKSPSPQPQLDTPPQVFKSLFDKHNIYRKNHKVSNLTWSNTISASASKWVKTCLFAHEEQQRYGENLAWMQAGTDVQTFIQLSTDMWYDEVKYYDYKKAQYSETTGHFTQMVWRDTKYIGCAYNYCKSKSGDYYILGCRYDPPGNVLGTFQKNVFSPITQP